MSREGLEGSGTDFFGNSLIPDFAEVAAATERNGVGYLQYPNGAIYEGEWLEGERHGHGVCFFPSGNIYVGQFCKGQMEGEGTLLFSTGECFTGEFRQCMMYKGVYSKEGREISGIWKDGQRISEMPTKAPEMLQRARAALFSTVVEQVHEYLWRTGDKSSNFTASAFPKNSPHGLPRDLLSSCVHEKQAVTVIGNAAGGNHSFSSTRLRIPSLADGEVRDAVCDTDSHFGSLNTVFACAAPSPNEVFSMWRFGQRSVVFLFPFLSLPWMPLAPCRITSLQEEREFVVSGAALRSDFDVPSFSLYAIALAMLSQITAIVIVLCRAPLGTVREGRITVSDVVVPCVLWLLVALTGASYRGFLRFPHGLEQVDRRLTPKLSAFAASLVDGKASVCIYTYDENGRGKVMNYHYKYRWLCLAIFWGVAISFAGPATRGGFGHNLFGTTGFEKAATVLVFCATFLFSSTLIFLVLKITDMQREIRAKLHVLTHLAFIEHKCLMNPSLEANLAFHLDSHLDVCNVFRGFPGWYCMRSLILYTSTCANHGARRMTMAVFWFAMMCAFVFGIADTVYTVGRNYPPSNQHYSPAHSYALVVFFAWGILLQRYLYVCLSTRREMLRQLYIMDIAGLYQRVKRKDAGASEIIQQCRRVSEKNDADPQIFPATIYSFVVFLTILLNVAALVAICYQLGRAIYN